MGGHKAQHMIHERNSGINIRDPLAVNCQVYTNIGLFGFSFDFGTSFHYGTPLYLNDIELYTTYRQKKQLKNNIGGN
jgi:hypothetical protein